MFGFNFGKKRVLGIDIGTSILKVVELEISEDKPPYLSNYAMMPIPEIKKGEYGVGNNAFDMVIPECLKKLYKEAGFTAREAYISISAFGGMITIIDLPVMPASELEQAVRFEAHKYIPMSLDEVTISWEVIEGAPREGDGGHVSVDKVGGEVDTDGSKMQIFLAAAFKSKISAYEKVVREAGLKLKGMEIESLSMVESLIGNDQGNFLIVDIGFRVCNIIYVEKGVIRTNRNIDAGGADITKAIARSMGISEERAESFKISGKNFFSVDSELRFSTVDVISAEVMRILEASSKDRKNYKVDGIILSGGTAGLAGLDKYFQDKFKIKTTIGNPFGRIAYDKKLESTIAKIKNEFSVSVGLALKEVEKAA